MKIKTILIILPLFSGIFFNQNIKTFDNKASEFLAVKDSVNISALLCLSGSCSDWGDAALKGARLAIKEINQAGGILGKQIVLKVEDSNEDVTTTPVTALKRILTKNKPDLIIGPTWSPAGLAIAPILKNEKVIAISPSLGVSGYNETSDNIFNLWPHDEISSRALAKLAIKEGYQRIAIFSVQQAWSVNQAEAFVSELKANGKDIVEKVEPLSSTTDLQIEAQRIVNSKPDLVVFTNYSEQAGTAAKRIKELGYTGTKYSILMEKKMIVSADGAFEGVIFARYPEAKKDFLEKFKAEYKSEPQTSADTAYDVIYLYADTAKKINSLSFELVKEALNKTQGYAGASGVINFDGKGGVVREPEFWEVKRNDMERRAPARLLDQPQT